MHAFLFITTDKDFIRTAIREKIKTFHISSDQMISLLPEKSLGIDKIRELRHVLKFKLRPQENRLIVIHEFEKTTAEAQNALLKLLEEPPVRTYYLIFASFTSTLLPTVLSRCQVVHDKSSKINTNDSTTEKLIDQLLAAGPGKRLQISAEMAAGKEEALQILDSLTAVLHQWLLEAKTGKLTLVQISSMLAKIQRARKFLEKNVNPKAVLDILLLGFPQKKDENFTNT